MLRKVLSSLTGDKSLSLNQSLWLGWRTLVTSGSHALPKRLGGGGSLPELRVVKSRAVVPTIMLDILAGTEGHFGGRIVGDFYLRVMSLKAEPR